MLPLALRFTAVSRDRLKSLVLKTRVVGCAVTLARQARVHWLTAPMTLLHDAPSLQLYSQITFRFFDIWLGLVMVFDAGPPSPAKVCHLPPAQPDCTRLWQSWKLSGRMTKPALLRSEPYTLGFPGRPMAPTGEPNELPFCKLRGSRLHGVC